MSASREGAPSGSSSSSTSPRAARLTFRSGGWVILLSLALVAGVAAWALLGLWSGTSRVGDGHTVESYGFDLSELRVPRERLAASGMARDALQALDDPAVADGRDVPELNTKLRRKIVVSTDRVLGVVIDGQARAYPLRILNAHEVVNDELAGVPIVVTYSPLGDTAAVFRRDATQRFGVSGLLLNSNLLFYDRDTRTPSLWSQLGVRAVAGPRAGEPLEPLPDVSLTTWAEWLARHPRTEVITGDPAARRRYTSVSYARYFGDGTLFFAVDPMPDEASLRRDGLRLKSPVTALRDPRAGDHESRWIVIPTERLVEVLARDRAGDASHSRAEAVAPEGDELASEIGVELEGDVEVDGLRLRAEISPAHTASEPPGVVISMPSGEPLLTVPSLWFVWHAFHPDSRPAEVRGAVEPLR